LVHNILVLNANAQKNETLTKFKIHSALLHEILHRSLSVITYYSRISQNEGQSDSLIVFPYVYSLKPIECRSGSLNSFRGFSFLSMVVFYLVAFSVLVLREKPPAAGGGIH